MKLSLTSRKTIFCLYFITGFLFFIQGQDRSDQFKLKRADNLYNQRLYSKSIDIYKELYSKNPTNSTFYQKYLQNLIQLKQYADAIKIVEFQILKYPKNHLNKNKLAQLYFKKQNKEKAFEIWKSLLEGPTLKIHEYSQIASTLISERLMEKAIEAYQAAQTKLNNPNLFLPTIARLYMYGFNYKKSFETYLYNLQLNPRYLNTTRRQVLQMVERPEALESVLENMDMIDPKNPNHLQIQASVYMKAKQFDDALKIITNPIFNKSNTLLNFGHEARKLNQHDLASKAYQYVIDNYDKKYHFQAFSGLLKTNISLIQLNPNLSDSISIVIDDLYQDSPYNNEIGIQLTYYHHLLDDRFQSKDVIQNLDKMIKTLKLKAAELERANFILAKAYFFQRNFKKSQEIFQRVPENYRNGEKYLYLSSIELITESKNIESLNNILRQRNGLTNTYLNDAIRILLLLNKNLKKPEDIKTYSESFYAYVKGQYSMSIELLDKLQLGAEFEIEKDRYRYEIYMNQHHFEAILKLFEIYKSEPEWQLKEAQFYIKTDQFDKALAKLNQLILDSPRHYYAIEARRLLREL